MRAVAFLLAALLVGGCAQDTAQSPSARPPMPSVNTGHTPTPVRVVGRLLGVGGPAPGTARPFPGRITVHEVGTPVNAWTVRTTAGGAYVVRLPPGRWHLSGHSPVYDGGHAECLAPHVVTVRGEHPVHINVYCQMM